MTEQTDAIFDSLKDDLIDATDAVALLQDAPLPADIEDALHEWRDLSVAMEAESADTAAQIAGLQQDLAERQFPYRHRLDALEELIKAITLNAGCGHSIDGVKVEYRRPSTRTSWDTKRLEGLALAFPAIIECRNVTPVQPSVTIKRVP